MTGRWINRDPIAERGGLNLYSYTFNDPLAFTDSLGLCRRKGEAFWGCLDRYARDFYGPALDWIDLLGWYGFANAAANAGLSAFTSATQAAADQAIKDAPLAGVNAGGSMLERQAAAAAAARSAARLTITKGVLAGVSKASGIVGAGASGFSIGARLAFIDDCTSLCNEPGACPK